MKNLWDRSFIAILALTLLSACGGSGDSGGNEDPFTADSQALQTSEQGLGSTAGLQFQTDGRTGYRWDWRFQENFLMAHPQVGNAQQIVALERYLNAADTYLSRYGTTGSLGSTLRAKISLARQTLVRLRPPVDPRRPN